jgi:hypothetical protein
MANGWQESAEAVNQFETAERDFWVFDRSRSEDVPDIAAAGLLAGLDSPPRRALAYRCPDVAHVRPCESTSASVGPLRLFTD